MDDAIMGGLFPMPSRNSAPGLLTGFNHARLWKRRRLRLEAEARETERADQEQSAMPGAEPIAEKKVENRKSPSQREASFPGPEAQL